MNKKTLLYPLSIAKQILYLPKTAHAIMTERQQVKKSLDTIKEQTATLSSLIEGYTQKIDSLESLTHKIDTKAVELKHSLSEYQRSNISGNTATVTVNKTVSDNHSLDGFYKLFEDKFRGSEQDIKLRVAEYKPLFTSLSVKNKKLPVIDLGCGRGEFLAFAKENKLKAVGIDMNYEMVNRANSLGYEAYETDAISYISKQKTNSIAAITGFHIVEHIPFESLMLLFEECYRVIAPGGFVLFETPNPKNIIVGTNNFYIDPSHIKPVPSELLAFSLESVGFESEIRPTHPQRKKISHTDKEVASLMTLVYGPQDYAVIARKK
jgi:SAM-dependent methyltransferase/exonuclease VII small subunit